MTTLSWSLNKHIFNDHESVVIGRENSDLTISDDSRISRQHAKVCYENGEYHLKDLGSSNGTYLNGEKVTQKPILPGLSFVVGDTTVFFKYLEDKNESAIEEKHTIREDIPEIRSRARETQIAQKPVMTTGNILLHPFTIMGMVISLVLFLLFLLVKNLF